jgi:hypothetical protein
VITDLVNICHKWTPVASRECPWNCPCEPPKQGFQSQQEPNRTIEEVVETVGFVRKIDDVREADFRLANRYAAVLKNSLSCSQLVSSFHLGRMWATTNLRPFRNL